MRQDDKKAAIAAYKERKPVGGVYLVRCLPTGEVWIGHWADLDTIRNRIWFSLRQGTHSNRGLQAAWTAHGAEAFRFEILERVDPEKPAFFQEADLRARAGHWRSRMGAGSL